MSRPQDWWLTFSPHLDKKGGRPYFWHPGFWEHFLGSPVQKFCSRTVSKLLPYSCTLSILLHLTYRELVSNLCSITAHTIFVSRATICRVAVVRPVRLELTHLWYQLLRLARLPIPPRSHIVIVCVSQTTSRLHFQAAEMGWLVQYLRYTPYLIVVLL